VINEGSSLSGFDANKRALFRRLSSNKDNPLRPPWSIDEYEFVDTCTACGDCSKACPENIIKLDPQKQPVIDFESGECTFCEKCVSSCEHGALVKRETPWFAKATVKASCLSMNQTMCRSCGDVCEKEAINFQLSLKGVATPVIDKNGCNGCGACVSVCPTKSIEIKV